MNHFWSVWAAVGTIVFFVLMVLIVVKYWRSNHKADKDRVLDTFDGIDENDGPPPKLLFVSYFIAFAISFGYLILYPGVGSWKGLMGYDQANDKLSSPTTTLEQEFTGLTDDSLLALAAEPAIVNSGRILFQTHCAACHRDNAQGAKHFPNLIDNEWLYGGSDEAIIHSIELGRNGAMPGWVDVLRPDEISKISYYLASLNQRHTDVPEIKVQLGKELFIKNCASCHGDGSVPNIETGVPDLADNIWLHGGSIEEIQHTIRAGLNNVMPAFGQQLTKDEILAIGAYITKARIDNNSRLARLDAASVERGEYLAMPAIVSLATVQRVENHLRAVYRLSLLLALFILRISRPM